MQSKAKDIIYQRIELNITCISSSSPSTTCTETEFSIEISNQRIFSYPKTMLNWLTLGHAEAFTPSNLTQSIFQRGGIERQSVCWQMGTTGTRWISGELAVSSSRWYRCSLCFPATMRWTKFIRFITSWGHPISNSLPTFKSTLLTWSSTSQLLRGQASSNWYHTRALRFKIWSKSFWSTTQTIE